MNPGISPSQQTPPPQPKPQRQRQRARIFAPVHASPGPLEHDAQPIDRPRISGVLIRRAAKQLRKFGELFAISLLLVAIGCRTRSAGEPVSLPPTIPLPGFPTERPQRRAMTPPAPPLPPGLALPERREVSVRLSTPPTAPGLHIETQGTSVLLWWIGPPARLEWSPDLGRWNALSPVESAVVVDADALSQPRRFYRVID